MKRLKKIKQFMPLIAINLLLLFSCSNDEEKVVKDNFAGVPTGEIVALELRDATLTGFEASAKKNEASKGAQKWWSHVISKVTYNGSACVKKEGEVLGEKKGYFAFYPNGGLYVRSSKNGTPIRGGSWKWKSSSKNMVVVTINGVSFDNKLTYLNANNVVYASAQPHSGCTAYTYEQFGSPY